MGCAWKNPSFKPDSASKLLAARRYKSAANKWHPFEVISKYFLHLEKTLTRAFIQLCKTVCIYPLPHMKEVTILFVFSRKLVLHI